MIDPTLAIKKMQDAYDTQRAAAINPVPAVVDKPPVTIAPPVVPNPNVGGAMPPIQPVQPKEPTPLDRDKGELERLKTTGSGISQIHNKPLRVLARIGDIAGSALFPTVMQNVPGSELHHRQLVRQAQGNVAQDLATQETEADVAKKNAPAKDENAGKTITTDKGVMQWNPTTQRYDIPAGKSPDKGAPTHIATDQGYFMVYPGGKVEPMTFNGQPLKPEQKERPETPHTVEVGDKVMQYNSETGRYDIPVGPAPKHGRSGGSGGGLSSLPSSQLKLVDEIGQGKMATANIDRILTKNPALLEAVVEKYPDFDQSKVKSYMQAYRDYTGSGKIGTQINAGSTALRHLARLNDINNKNPIEVLIPGTKANKAYNNLLDTVAGELLTFYGTPKTNETLSQLKGTLGGMTNRGAAIKEQALAMGAKFDELEQTWRNAAPSAAYHSPMPEYSNEAKEARAALDPEYAARVKGGQTTSGAVSASPQGPNAGDVVDGFRFKGGNPADKSNWQPVAKRRQ